MLSNGTDDSRNFANDDFNNTIVEQHGLLCPGRTTAISRSVVYTHLCEEFFAEFSLAAFNLRITKWWDRAISVAWSRECAKEL